MFEQEAQELNRFFFEHVKSGMPFVHLKIAQSLDGFIASKNSRLRYLTSPASRKLVQRWRAEYDAVLVGARTIAIDDPRLDVRYVHGRDPAVVVLDGRFRVSEKSRIFKMASNRRVFLFVETAIKSLALAGRPAPAADAPGADGPDGGPPSKPAPGKAAPPGKAPAPGKAQAANAPAANAAARN